MRKIVGKKELLNIMESLEDSSKGVLPSKKVMKAVINNERSLPTTLSDKPKEFAKILRELGKKTGFSYRKDINNLRRQLSRLEEFYKGRSLNAEPPDLQIGSD